MKKSNPSDASTLILISPSNGKPHSQYETLLLKRSSKSSFMPNACVFPGGKVEDTDFSEQWRDLFCQYFDWQEILQSLPKSCLPRCDCYNKLRQSCIPADIGLRICAIRETFEESGVLLLRNFRHNRLPVDGSHGNIGSAHNLPIQQLQYWRRLVNEDSSNFLKLCRHFNSLPDIWSLYEWSNWLTPRTYPKRFDTAFFICCAEGEINASQDQAEITYLHWTTPEEALKSHAIKKIFLAPPQTYELSRLCNEYFLLPYGYSFHTVPEILQFARHRAMNFPTKQYLPIHYQCKDGLLSLLPGDSLYPEDEQQESNRRITSNKSISELRISSERVNRVEYEKRDKSNYVTTYRVEVLPENFSIDGHKVPYLEWQNVQSDSSKL
ncbi:Nucleoside diphosphate-linked moiety X motif 19 [Trichoplax sp. H2]|nr:Nucleoside diphosphate-linked moiety X motif 19 [Trichoplax sp. H2]|eukprot:RDD41095.1 Nucleoside diphosphate-linked moiety X motif 19 [Trichoplax sp. H2]